MLKTLVLICMAGCALAVCPIFDTVPGLDLARQINTWQIHGILRPSEKIGNLECLNVAITGENLGVQPVHLKGHAHGTNLDTGDMIMIDATATVTNLQRPGRWSVSYGGVTFAGSVIYTDYLEYSLFALCNDQGPEDLLDIFFMSRLHDPISNSTRDNFLAKLKNEYFIEPTNYVPIYHDHHKCGH